jgi:Uma2 family endonuclease
MGALESAVGVQLVRFLGNFVEDHDLGFLLGADGALRLMPKLVRIPDVTFISWAQMPSHEYPIEPIPKLQPELAVEVLSEGNTDAEMRRKLGEYFRAGARLVWFIDPDARTVQVFTGRDEVKSLTEKDTLDGGRLLPGFRLSLKLLFARVPKARTRKNGRPRRKS